MVLDLYLDQGDENQQGTVLGEPPGLEIEGPPTVEAFKHASGEPKDPRGEPPSPGRSQKCVTSKHDFLV